MTETDNLAQSIIEGMQERKGHNITVVDMSQLEHAGASTFIICTGNSSMQVDAIADSVREYVHEHAGTKPYNYDGYANSEWIVIDYGTIFAHIFLPDVRERYNLEELWYDATIKHIADIY